MATFSRRAAVLALGSATALTVGIVGPVATAGAADPITTQAPPTLTAPANNTGTAIKDVVLKWTAVTYATAYQVQLSPNNDFTNNQVTLPDSGKTVGTTYELPLSVPHDEYFWRVRAMDANGVTDWSNVRSFLKDWSNGITILKAPTGADPSISWTPDPEASIYRVRISTQADFPTDAAKTGTCWTANTSWTPYTLVSSTEKLTGDCMKATDMADGLTYFYEVSAWDDSTAAKVDADNAPDPSFECGAAQPECDAATVGALGTFDYSTPLAGSPSGAPTGLQTTWHTASLPGTDCTGGSCPVTPTFSWNPVVGANYYRVAIFHDPLLTNAYRVYDTLWPSVTPRDAFLDAQSGHGFYWTVSAGTCTNSDVDPSCDKPVLVGDVPSGGGGGGGSSNIKKVFVGTSSAAQFAKSSGSVPLSSPANGSTVTQRGVTFQWGDYLSNGGQQAYDARNYRVQVANDPDFTDVVFDNSDIDMSQWTNASSALGDGLYYWHVQPIDESGNKLQWSATRHFTKDSTPPVFRLTDSSPIGVTSPLHVTVDDSALQGTVSKNSLQIVPVVGGGSPVPGDWQLTGANRWTFTPTVVLVPGQSYALAVVPGTITDQAGNDAIASSRTVRTSGRVEDNNPAFHYGSGWKQVSASGALGGTFHRGTRGSSAVVSVVGKTLSVYACKAPHSGRLNIKVDGTTVASPSLAQSFTKCGLLVYRNDVSTTKVHTVRVTAVRGPVELDRVAIS